MTYNPSIPLSTDNISVSQGQILDNFGELNTQFGIDHSPYFTGSINGDGFHKKSTYKDQTGTIPTSAAKQNTVYAVTSTSPQVITSLRYQHDATGTVFTLNPIRAYALASITSATTVTLTDGFNIASLTTASGNITVTLTDTMNTTGTGAYGVMAYAQTVNASTSVVTIVSPTQFIVRTSFVSFPSVFSIIVLGT